MIIAQISDTHVALDAPDADRRMQDFASTIADINALDPAPDVIVHTGDIVHNGRPDEYAQAAAVLAMARAPLYVLPGNKDERTNLRPELLRDIHDDPSNVRVNRGRNKPTKPHVSLSLLEIFIMACANPPPKRSWANT